jgi:hypothetical protein
MEMLVRPPQDELKDMVKVSDRGICGNEETTPDQGTDAPQGNLELVNNSSWWVKHEGSLSELLASHLPRFLADSRKVLKRLDGPLDETVPANRSITVRDLLTFRMGLGMIMESSAEYPIQKAVRELEIVGFGPPNQSTPHDPDEWIRRLATLPLMHQPGERWMYNGCVANLQEDTERGITKCPLCSQGVELVRRRLILLSRVY